MPDTWYPWCFPPVGRFSRGGTGQGGKKTGQVFQIIGLPMSTGGRPLCNKALIGKKNVPVLTGPPCRWNTLKLSPGFGVVLTIPAFIRGFPGGVPLVAREASRFFPTGGTSPRPEA